MNREILFRGKRIDNGEWVYGYAVKGCDKDNQMFIAQSIGIVFFTGGISAKEVIPETIGQYTGLTDKNGTKIFEGDIIRFCKYAFEWEDKSNWKLEIGYIRYEDGCFIIDDIYSSDGYNELSCVYYEISCGGEYDSWIIFEVIGNIHDNPELLEV